MTRYELTERIGAGAMAEIFRGKAVASGGFEKPVAIKRILPHLTQDERFVEILIAEANIVSHLRHRNIVQVFDVGLGPDGQYFVVMELVEGCNLGSLQSGLEARQKRMPIGIGLHIGAEICDALEHAHRAPGPDGRALRLVHRDVSPNNVLLSRSGEVKLTDFGIAKRSEEVSLHGGVRGKFAYISPEQGSGRAVDARSDVFSVGILLFEMITGRRLFSGLPDFEALKAVCDGKVPRPRVVDPKLDPKLEAILLKALAHAPDDRYPGAGELGKELRGYRYSLPSTGGDPAAELATLVTRFSGRQPQAKRESPAAVPRPKPDDFTGGTNTFTLEEEASLVRKTTYEEAWQKFREEETRVARSYQAASESGSMPSATMLGLAPMGAAHGDHDGDVSEEDTRIVDPYLRASSRAGKDDDEGIPEDIPEHRGAMSSESSTQPVAGHPGSQPLPPARPHGLSQSMAQATSRPMSQAMPQSPSMSRPGAADAGRASPGAYSLTSARIPGSAAVLDDVEGVPPETLELHGAQAMAMVDAVEAVVAAQEAARAAMARPTPATAAAADPSAVIRVAAVPAGDPSLRKGFPRWAVILFVVLLVGIILAGFFLGDGNSSKATPGAGDDPATTGQAATGGPAQPAAKLTEAQTAGQAQAAAQGTGPTAAQGTEPTATQGTEQATGVAVATPGTDTDAADTRAGDRVESTPRRPRTTEKSRSSSTEKSRSSSAEKSRSSSTEKSRSSSAEKSRSSSAEKSRSSDTRKARQRDRERQKRRRDRNR